MWGEARRVGGTLDHPGEAGRRKRGSPLADEHKGRGLALPLDPAEELRTVYKEARFERIIYVLEWP
jgi:hypothetical protein